MTDQTRVLVLGAGVIGASVAYHLARAGCRVVVAAREASPAAPMASWASAGGLKFQRLEEAAAELTVRSSRRWPRLAEELEASLGLRLWGSLEVAITEADLPALEQQLAKDRRLGMSVELLSGDDFSQVGADLADDLVAGALVARGGQADPRRTTQAFLRAAARHGAEIIEAEALSLRLDQERVRGANFAKQHRAADLVVVAAGFWSVSLARSAGIELPLRPAGAHMLLSQPLPRRLHPTVSAVGRVLSIKQLPGGELLVGGGWPALVDQDQRSCLVQPESVERNLTNSSRVVPWAAAADLAVGWCGIDGETPDQLPLIGPVPGMAGLYLATGFSLGGFQIAPAVGELVAAEISGGQPEGALEQLRPARFEPSSKDEIARFQESQRGIPAR